MGLPKINITFSSLAVSVIQRSGRGVVALIVKDDTNKNIQSKEYHALADIRSQDWTPANFQYLQDAFLGVPSKVIVERIDTKETNYSAALTRLASKLWNYMAVPGVSAADTPAIAAQVKTWRDNHKKTYKAVLANTAADHEGIINFTTEGIQVGLNTTYSALQYTARIAGILAGLPLTRSATFYELPEVKGMKESATPDADIDAGKLILVSDGEKIKIGRGVNSLTTTTVSKGVDFKKIKIIEGHDMVQEDIIRTFNDQYAGKVNNSYDNQVLLLTAINGYLKGLEGGVLDPSADNCMGVDVEAQRRAWESIGTDTSSWDNQEVKEQSFQSQVFISGRLKFLDAVEDVTLNIQV